jgi:hypothetical protein
MSFSFKTSERIFEIKSMRLDVRALAAVELSFALGEVASPKDLAGLALPVLSPITLRSARISYEDHGFANRYLDAEAKKQNKDRRVLAGEMLHGSLLAGAPPDISATLTQFITNPQRLTLSVEPTSPKGFAEIMRSALSGTEQVARELNLRVTAE